MATQTENAAKATGKKFFFTKEELVNANKFAIIVGYNRAVNEQFMAGLPDGEYTADILWPHHHRQGVECEPHVRVGFTALDPSTGEKEHLSIDMVLALFNRACERQGINPFEKKATRR